MISTIAKQYTFDAAHRLDKLPPEHKCHRMHGHTYRVEIMVRGPVKNGFVVDYADLDALWQPLHERLDHRVLNEVSGLDTPSTEHLAGWILIRLVGMPQLQMFYVSVRVYESSSTWCEVESIDDISDDFKNELLGWPRSKR